MSKQIPTTVSVKLTEGEIDWIINELMYSYEAVTEGNDPTEGLLGDMQMNLAKKLQGRLEARGLEQSHLFGRKPTSQEIADAKFMSYRSWLISK
jgi:hypothetical protein